MKISRKLLSLLLTITFLFTLAVPVFAKSQNTNTNVITTDDIKTAKGSLFQDSINSIMISPKDFGFTENEWKNAQIGSSFQFNDIDQNGNIEVNKNILYFPIFSSDKVIAILTLLKDDGYLSCSIGKCFSNNLNKCLEKYQNTKLALVANNCSLYAVTPINNYVEIFKGPFAKNSSSIKSANKKLLAFKDVAKTNNVISSESIKPIVTSELLENLNKRTINNGKAKNKSSGYPASKNLENYPVVNQRIGSKQYGMCWAATIASMIRFELPNNYPNLTAQNVCDTCGIGYDTGANSKNVPNYLEKYLPSIYAPTYYSSDLSKNDIMVIINNIDPAYLDWQSSDNGHATALCGYSDSGSTIRIMDPAQECYISVTKGWFSYKYTLGNEKFTWKQTVCLLYNL